jgi:transposase
MQDGAPFHDSKKTRNFLDDENVDILDWPGYSPDLNPMDNIWAWLKDAIYQIRKKIATKDQLWKIFEELFFSE